LKKSENFTPALNNLAYLYAENYGSKEEALELAMRDYRQDPANPAIMDTLGYVLVKNGRAEDAGKLLEKAVTLLPGNASVCYHLALAYQKLGKKDEAIDFLRKALESEEFPEVKEARSLLGKLADS